MDLAEALDPQRAGTRLATIDQADMAEKMANIGLLQGNLAMQPAKRRLLEAQARETEADATGKEHEASVQKNLAAALASGEGAGLDPIEQIELLASGALSAGAFNLAMKATEAATSARRNEQQQLAAQALAQQRKAKQDIEELNFADGLFRNVKSPEEWDQAQAQFKMIRGKPSPFANMQYQPGLPQQLSRSMLSTKDALELQIKEDEQKLRKRNTEARETTANARAESLRAATERVRQQIDIVRKNGGNSAPELKELRETQTKLNNARLAANAGRTADNPHTTIPAEPDLKVGQFYKMPKGVLQWTGRGFIEPGQSMPATPGQRTRQAISDAGNFATDRSIGAILGLLPDDEGAY